MLTFHTRKVWSTLCNTLEKQIKFNCKEMKNKLNMLKLSFTSFKKNNRPSFLYKQIEIISTLTAIYY